MLINHRIPNIPSNSAFALLSIPLGWFTIHCHGSAPLRACLLDGRREIDAETKRRCRSAASIFPASKRPEGWDFLYFADGDRHDGADRRHATSRPRICARFVLVHAILSFFFNTVIVAAAVNLAV